MGQRWARCEGVVERQVRENLILVPLKTGPARLDALYTLNETAAVVWREAGQSGSEDAAVAQLVAEYDVDADTARNDVRAVADRLVAIGAIRIET